MKFLEVEKFVQSEGNTQQNTETRYLIAPQIKLRLCRITAKFDLLVDRVVISGVGV